MPQLTTAEVEETLREELGENYPYCVKTDLGDFPMELQFYSKKGVPIDPPFPIISKTAKNRDRLMQFIEIRKRGYDQYCLENPV